LDKVLESTDDDDSDASLAKLRELLGWGRSSTDVGGRADKTAHSYPGKTGNSMIYEPAYLIRGPGRGPGGPAGGGGRGDLRIGFGSQDHCGRP